MDRRDSDTRGRRSQRKCARGPQATMDVHLNTLGGQESASNSSKGSGSTGDQQDVAIGTDDSEMTDVTAVVNSFASSARAGRRNAIPDIQGSAGIGGTSELPLELQALSIKEDVKKKNEETTKDQLEKPPNEGK